MDDEFVTHAKMLVPYIMSKDNLVKKTVNSREMAGRDWFQFVKVSNFLLCVLQDYFG